MSENMFCNVSVQTKPTGLMHRHPATSAVCSDEQLREASVFYCTKFGAELLFQFLGLLIIQRDSYKLVNMCRGFKAGDIKYVYIQSNNF